MPDGEGRGHVGEVDGSVHLAVGQVDRVCHVVVDPGEQVEGADVGELGVLAVLTHLRPGGSGDDVVGVDSVLSQFEGIDQLLLLLVRELHDVLADVVLVLVALGAVVAEHALTTVEAAEASEVVAGPVEELDWPLLAVILARVRVAVGVRRLCRGRIWRRKPSRHPPTTGSTPWSADPQSWHMAGGTDTGRTLLTATGRRAHTGSSWLDQQRLA